MNKEIPEWILENLCYYDERNPNHQIEFRDESPEIDLNKDKCACDNCFYNRTKLANELVKMYEKKIN